MELQEKVDQLTSEGYEFKFGEYLSEGFELFKTNIGYFIGFGAIAFTLTLVVSFIPFIGSFASAVLNAVTILGFYHVGMKTKKGMKVEFEDFFKPFNAIGEIIGTSILVYILTVIGIIAFIIPGIYLSVAWTFAVPVVYFFKSPMWDSMEASRKVITKNWWWFFLFAIVIGLINALGVIALFVGVFFTLPISYLALFAAFNDIFKPSAEVVDFTGEHIDRPDEEIYNN
jgi:uncharacterized membrane protein